MDSAREDAAGVQRTQWLNVKNLMHIGTTFWKSLTGILLKPAGRCALPESSDKRLFVGKESINIRKNSTESSRKVSSSPLDLSSTLYWQGCALGILAKNTGVEASPLEPKERVQIPASYC